MKRLVLLICLGGAALVQPPALRAQTASLSGQVLSDPGERSIANAEVVFTASKLGTRSDRKGVVLITGIAAGSYEVTVRAVGYEPYNGTVSFRDGEKVEADFILRTTSTKLAKVDVIAKASEPYKIQLEEFEERRKAGVGKFITADVFEHEAGRPASSFLAAHIAGLKIVQFNGERLLTSARGEVIGSKKPQPMTDFKKYPEACYMKVVLNGRTEYDGSYGQEAFDLDKINTKDIIGFEFYTVATTPLKYGGTSARATACGTVVIWTKFGS